MWWSGRFKVQSCKLTILKWIVSDPGITQVELAEKTGISVRTIKREMEELKVKGYIRLVNGKRDGVWEVLVDVT